MNAPPLLQRFSPSVVWRVISNFPSTYLRGLLFLLALILLLRVFDFFHNYLYGENIKIHIAAQDGDLVTIREMIQANPALVSSQYYIGTHGTPLHWASAKDQKNVVTFLLANGAEVNARDNAGRTPLYYATLYHNRDVMELLSQNGGRQ